MQTLIIHTEESKLAVIKQFLQELKVSFEIKEENKNPYNPEFVAKIEKSRQQAKEGKERVVSLDEIWK